MALRDYEAEEGPYDLSCALEVLAEAQGAADAGALHVCPWHCPQRAWVESGGTQRHRSDTPPSWVADPRLWEEARSAVGRRWDEFGNPWQIVLDVYRARGGAFR